MITFRTMKNKKSAFTLRRSDTRKDIQIYYTYRVAALLKKTVKPPHEAQG